MQRFLCSQALAMSMKGVPAIYFQSLIGAENDYDGLEATGRNRTINRKKWNEFELGEHLADSSSRGAKIFARLKELLQVRATEPAFHPNASQEILNYGDGIFALHRESIDLESKVLCIYNFTATLLQLAPMNQPMQILTTGETWESGYSYNLQPYQALWLLYS